MKIRLTTCQLALLLCLVLSGRVALAGPPQIEVEALFKGTAVVKIDGERKTLRVGQSFAGVKLLASYSRTATFEVDGQQTILGISRRIGTSYEAPSEQVVTIKRNGMLQYQTNATINGRKVNVMVDTGANVVALSAAQASALGIDYKSGRPAKVQTAAGLADAWVVTLHFVSVGGIRVDNVQASVVDGNFPTVILLGMTYLQHVDIKESNGVLSLSRAW